MFTHNECGWFDFVTMVSGLMKDIDITHEFYCDLIDYFEQKASEIWPLLNFDRYKFLGII